MKLKGSVLALFMLVGVAALTGCNDEKVKVDQDNTAASATVPAPIVSDSDATDETATSAPPAPEADPQGSAPGPDHVWVAGTWRFLGGHYVWNRGRWETPRSGYSLVPGRWAEENGRWVRHPARWATRGGERPG